MSLLSSIALLTFVPYWFYLLRDILLRCDYCQIIECITETGVSLITAHVGFGQASKQKMNALDKLTDLELLPTTNITLRLLEMSYLNSKHYIIWDLKY
jgi:hypothetical protein